MKLPALKYQFIHPNQATFPSVKSVRLIHTSLPDAPTLNPHSKTQNHPHLHRPKSPYFKKNHRKTTPENHPHYPLCTGSAIVPNGVVSVPAVYHHHFPTTTTTSPENPDSAPYNAARCRRFRHVRTKTTTRLS